VRAERRAAAAVSRGPVQGAFDALVKCAIKSGDIRKEINSEDLLRVLVGVFFAGFGPGWWRSARRLVDISLRS